MIISDVYWGNIEIAEQLPMTSGVNHKRFAHISEVSLKIIPLP